MKATGIVASLFRFTSLLGLLAGFLFTSCPALASEAKTPEKLTASQQKTFTDELAERVEAKAKFSASVAPRLAGAKSHFSHSSQYEKTMLIDWLWDLRSNPALQQEWLDKITASADKAINQNDMRGELAEFVEETQSIADDLQHKETGTAWSVFRAILLQPAHKDEPKNPDLAQTARKLAEAKARDQAFADALVIANVYRQAGISLGEGREYAGLLLSIKNRPEDLALAASLIENDSISRDRLGSLLRTLASDPEAARKEVAALEKTLEAEKRYLFATKEEGYFSFTLLPLASILPDAVKPVEKPGTIPLAASPVMEPEKTLSITSITRLVPEDFSMRDRDGNKKPLPFLLPGERLYTVDQIAGTPIFAKTPLDILAPSGPVVTELAPGDATFMNIFPEDMGSQTPSRFLVAAVCGPEELAAHFAGLSVMVTARESSVYGPYEDFLWSSRRGALEWAKHKKGLPRELPADLPGETARLVQIQHKMLFLALAPIADKKGLARLMGPVRGMWSLADGRCEPQQWIELRYTPKAGKPKAFVLGSAPLLKLGKPAIEALNASLEQSMIRFWTNYKQRDLITTDMGLCRENYPAALADMEAKFASIRAKRFVSPLDISEALALLEKYDKDAAMLEKLRAVLDDTSRSSIKRMNAMEDIAYGEIKD